MLSFHRPLLLLLSGLLLGSIWVEAQERTLFTDYENKLDFWAYRYRTNVTNWHRDQIHPALRSLGDRVGLPYYLDDDSCVTDDKNEKIRVFVPLCGKTLDLAYFARHPFVEYVQGVDGVAQALESFANEHSDLEVKSHSDEKTVWSGRKIGLLQTNFFDLDPTTIMNKEGLSFDLVFDRGALVAIDPSLRSAYMNIIGQLIKPHTGKVLLSAVERQKDLMGGPPFTVTEDDVKTLYEAQPWVKMVEGPLEGEPDPGDDPAKWISKYYIVHAK